MLYIIAGNACIASEGWGPAAVPRADQILAAWFLVVRYAGDGRSQIWTADQAS